MQALNTSSNTTSNTTQALSPEQLSKGFYVAVNVLQKWRATTDQMARVLGVSTATIGRAKRKERVKLTRDQIDRSSYVLNIHAALRIVFDNPENVYNFVHLENHNPYFNGRTPFSLMDEGSMANLYEVYRRIDVMRGAQW